VGEDLPSTKLVVERRPLLAPKERVRIRHQTEPYVRRIGPEVVEERMLAAEQDIGREVAAAAGARPPGRTELQRIAGTAANDLERPSPLVETQPHPPEVTALLGRVVA